MKIDTGSNAWYYDEASRTSTGKVPSYVWTYGFEAWCNLEGQYLSIVSDLNHLTSPYQMSLCSVGVMGTSYIRDEPLPEKLVIVQGETKLLDVPHIFSEYPIGTTHRINLRQQTSLELPFVTISE